MHTCYVIDDEKYAVATLENYIGKIPELMLIGSHTNPLLALQAIDAGMKPQIVFLDVDMPELSGLAVADMLPSGTAIVFTTAHAKYALNAFEKNAKDFLLKPFSFEMFVKSVAKVKDRLRKEAAINQPIVLESIFINPGIKGRIIQINVAEITHIEALDHLVCIHTKIEKCLTKLSMKELHTKIAAADFVRVHRSFMVNVDQIKSFDYHQITLYNGTLIPIGKSYRLHLLAHIQPKTIKESG